MHSMCRWAEQSLIRPLDLRGSMQASVQLLWCGCQSRQTGPCRMPSPGFLVLEGSQDAGNLVNISGPHSLKGTSDHGSETVPGCSALVAGDLAANGMCSGPRCGTPAAGMR